MTIKSTIFCPDFGTANRAYAEALTNDVTKLRLDYIGDSKSVPYEWMISFECENPTLSTDILENIQGICQVSDVKTEIEL